MTPLSPLAGALLGLLNEQPRSGYDLRKVFALTPMRHFSDSPGAIYPALRRLRTARLIVGSIDERAPLRPREVFRLTPKGLAALKAWASAPPTRDDIVRGMDRVMLRFVLTHSSAGPVEAERFLEQLEAEIVAYSAELRAFHAAATPTMHAAARLGLENGMEVFRTHQAWCRRARASLRKGGGDR